MDTRSQNPGFSVPGNDHEKSPSKKPWISVARQTVNNLWSNLQNSCQILCRVIGLNILVSSLKFLRHPWGKGFEETTKISIRKSQPIALLRALVHVIPVGIALWEVIFTWNTYYVGSYLLKQVYYQTAAKLHEIMIQASLAAIIFSYIRHQMVLGRGIPFGALFSGLQINQISYLWSIEFWGSLSSNYLSIWRKITILVFVSFCFILAAVAGPSSAILLIPRLSYWPAGSTHVWVNATFNDIWPNRMNGSLLPRHCLVMEAGSPSDECPSSEWEFMRIWMSLFKNNIPVDIKKQSSILRRQAIGPEGVRLTGKSSTRQYKVSPVDVRGILSDNSSFDFLYIASTTQQVVVADALTSLSSIWTITTSNDQIRPHHGASIQDQQKAVHTIAQGYYQPYSYAVCIRDTILGPNDQRSMGFPIIPRYSELDLNASAGVPVVEAPSIKRSQLLKLPGLESDNRVKWVQLPKGPQLYGSIGLTVLLPSNPPDLSKHNITAIEDYADMVICTTSAGWGASSINLTAANGGNSATSSSANIDFSSDSNNSFPNRNHFQTLSDQSFVIDEPVFPSIPIEIDVTWAEYLNPYVPSANTTVIDILLKQSALNGSKAGLPEVAAMNIVSGLVVNGLARSGFTSELQGKLKLTEVNADLAYLENNGSSHTVPDGNIWLTGKNDIFTVDPEESKDWVKLRVDSTVQGYAYNMDGPAPKTAIAFVLTYCCLALGHILYSGISGISSTCWDSISEVMALAMNSPPTTILRNTCAGISEIRIFRTPVRVLTMGDQEGEGEHLELVFGHVDEENAQTRAIKFNRKYGTMPAGKTLKLD